MSLPTLALAVGCIAMQGCSDRNVGPAPEIADLVFPSPLPSDTTRLAGTVVVRDPAGLTALLLSLSVTGPGPTATFAPVPIDTVVQGQTEATVAFKLKSKVAFAPGTYQLSVSVTEDGIPSNSLTLPMFVE